MVVEAVGVDGFDSRRTCGGGLGDSSCDSSDDKGSELDIGLGVRRVLERGSSGVLEIGIEKCCGRHLEVVT